MNIEEIEKQIMEKLNFYEERTIGGMNSGINKSIIVVRDLFKEMKVKENDSLHSVSYCACDFKDRDLAKTSHLVCNECKKAL